MPIIWCYKSAISLGYAKSYCRRVAVCHGKCKWSRNSSSTHEYLEEWLGHQHELPQPQRQHDERCRKNIYKPIRHRWVINSDFWQWHNLHCKGLIWVDPQSTKSAICILHCASCKYLGWNQPRIILYQPQWKSSTNKPSRLFVYLAFT